MRIFLGIFLGIFVFCLLFLQFAAVTVEASPYPESGFIYRTYKDDSFRNKWRSVPSKPTVSLEKELEDTGEKFFVNGYDVHGNTKLTKSQIETALSPFTNKKLSSIGLYKAANALMSAYRHKDVGLFTARVYLPEQSIQDGIVTLHVYEGVLEEGGVILINSGKNIHDQTVHSILKKNLTTGIMTRKEFERTILLIEDLPGISSYSTIYPGEQVGGARYLMQIVDESKITGNVDIDNFGSVYTGEVRYGFTVYFNSPTKRGDQLTMRYVTSGNDSNYGFLSYDILVSGNGMRAGLSLDYLDYKLGKQYRSLDSKGDALNTRFFVNYPFLRSRHSNLKGQLSYSHSEFDDSDNTGLRAERKINSVILNVSGDHDDELFAAGITNYSLTLTLGSLDIRGNDAFKIFDNSFTGTDGSFHKINYSISRLQHLYGNLSTSFSVRGQFSSQNLDSSEKFFIGGPFSVPGYPTGESSGDDGAIGHADLRYDFYDLPWKGKTQLSLFYASGWTKLHHDPWVAWQGTNSIIKNDIVLQSVGIGLHQTWADRIAIRGLIGWQIGENDGRDPATGEDSDKSDKSFRAWIQSIYYF